MGAAFAASMPVRDLTGAKLSVFRRDRMVRPYKTIQPKLGDRAWVDVSAQVIGDVELGEDASVWMGSVVRGDVNLIRIGARSNVQDACVLHVTAQHPTVLAEDVTVGHSVTLHGCTVERLCLIGIGAIVLNGAVVGEESIVAAGALVPEGMQVPPRSLVMGAPAKVKRPVTDAEREKLRWYSARYVGLKEDYRQAEGAAS
jgi:carbonic anhydrase/acetyltransferase-like protein (isoleucine patch superfamily)